MKHLLLLYGLTTFFLTSQSQLTKGNCLVGGTGNFLFSKNSYISPTYSSSSDRVDIKISSGVGYFIIDRFPIRLRTSFSKYKEVVDGTSGNLNANINRLEIGPFVRYYFLETEK